MVDNRDPVISVRVPREIVEKLDETGNRSEAVRQILAKHFNVKLPPPVVEDRVAKMIEEEVKRQLAWIRLK